MRRRITTNIDVDLWVKVKAPKVDMQEIINLALRRYFDDGAPKPISKADIAAEFALKNSIERCNEEIKHIHPDRVLLPKMALHLYKELRFKGFTKSEIDYIFVQIYKKTDQSKPQ